MTSETGAIIVSIRVIPVDVTPKTRWIFVEIRDGDGVVGYGEATLGEASEAVVHALESRATALTRDRLDPKRAINRLGKPHTLADAAAVSALDQALHDIIARHGSSSIAALLGGERRSRIGLYANINRRTDDRTAEGFAQSARLAVAAGHNAIKIAPFDEITPSVCADQGFSAALENGLARIAAVRETIGPARRLMVDCHWRFNEVAAREAITRCAEFSLHWFECPIDEGLGNLSALKSLRNHAHSNAMLLAGGEKIYGLDGLLPFVQADAYDVMMPDVKYAGGLHEMLRMAEVQATAGIAFSPHNPTGPIAHAASLEICAAIGETDLLEQQFDETPLFSRLVDDALPKERDGHVDLAPSRIGFGVSIAGTGQTATAQ